MKVNLDRHGTITISAESDLESFALSSFIENWEGENHKGIVIDASIEGIGDE